MGLKVAAQTVGQLAIRMVHQRMNVKVHLPIAIGIECDLAPIW